MVVPVGAVVVVPVVPVVGAVVVVPVPVVPVLGAVVVGAVVAGGAVLLVLAEKQLVRG